ncbi:MULTISPECIES: phage portal protein [unclassified Sphingomonas]|jgi:HK97 family phage portal protein|uniref:phage portal protein n=1 Tax=unclassified Sphingomonas TaxID=196159 RepID=UPI000E103C4E|nr:MULTISPECIES: phage portal protein [unclassified Sphingomonas]AXJ95480.1 phage portal protein [Sphingomonas sp. FARSPH]
MRLFGKRPRDGARPALARAGGLAEAGTWPRSYEAQLREGYAGNPIAQRAVKLVAEGVAGAPIAASDPAIAALVGARDGGQMLLETAAAQLLLHGNAYIQVLRDGDGGAAALYALRPERVSVEVDAGGWPAAYRYRVGERVTRLAADGPRPDIVHIRSFNPLDDHYGMGCLAVAAGPIAIHNAAARWNKALLDNAARPSGALVYDPGDGSALSADQFDRLKAEMEAGFAGAGNAGRPMLLEGGLRWQALSLSPADMDFVGLKAAAAREIALAFGVPPMLLGLPGDATYANYREANRALWRLTVLPLADTVLTGIAQGLVGWFADAALSVDLDRVPALAEDRAQLWASVGAADFLSVDEKRAKLGFGEAGR